MLNYLPMLIQLTEKDKRLIIALFILLIVVFVLIAYIVNGIKAVMNRYSKGIDGYMHDLCAAGLVKNSKEFKSQVYKRETKVLFLKTRWAFRIGILVTALLLVYGFAVAKNFDFFGSALSDLVIKLDWPKGQFFGIKNFPIDWPTVAKGPTPKFCLDSVVTYVCFLAYIYVGFIIITGTMRFIARLNRARVKSVDVFNKSLDNFTVGEGETNE